MLHETPLRKHHEQYVDDLTAERQARQSDVTADRPGAASAEIRSHEIPYIPYAVGDATEAACELVAAFSDLELEYSAIRKGCGVFDASHRGTIEVTGSERVDFLSRMLTQSLDGLAAGDARESFWLNRKGRIEADLLLGQFNDPPDADRMLISVDINQAASTVETLDAYIFSEDVALRDASSDYHHLTLDGALAIDVLRVASETPELELEPGRTARVMIRDVPVTAIRRDTVGQPGVELIVAWDETPTVWKTLLLTDATIGEGKRRIRPIGWYAYNIARIEAGTPIFNVDFGTNNLPHESGLLHDRVNFKKGCYLGQEVVARMESLGRPARLLTGFRMHDDERQPVAGAQVFERQDDGSIGGPVGIVTSSTISPLLGAASIGFAMIKTAHATDGAGVIIDADGEQSTATLLPMNRFVEDCNLSQSIGGRNADSSASASHAAAVDDGADARAATDRQGEQP